MMAVSAQLDTDTGKYRQVLRTEVVTRKRRWPSVAGEKIIGCGRTCRENGQKRDGATCVVKRKISESLVSQGIGRRTFR